MAPRVFNEGKTDVFVPGIDLTIPAGKSVGVTVEQAESINNPILAVSHDEQESPVQSEKQG